MRGPVIASAIIAAVLLVGGFLTLGIPGAIYAIPAAPVVEVLRGMEFGTLVDGDRAWGMALLLTLLVPVAIPILVWAGMVWFRANIWPTLGLTLVGMWAWSCALLFWVSFQ
jgi:hypothetical protein